MKKLVIGLFTVVMLALVGCSGDADHEGGSFRDLGSHAVPGKRYVLHEYRLTRALMDYDHYLYVVEEGNSQVSSRDSDVKEVLDKGYRVLPGQTLRVHTYELVRSIGAHNHFVQILEDDGGNPVLSSNMNYDTRVGKSTRNQTVSVVVPPALFKPRVIGIDDTEKVDLEVPSTGEVNIRLACNTQEQCDRIADGVKKAAAN